ncbi:MAG: hypothetical protein H3C62_13420, partial [Gemmatimonadaceae bacterium]|nr:hypothetical protein [Gemmatimonadaceae bacterium]
MLPVRQILNSRAAARVVVWTTLTLTVVVGAVSLVLLEGRIRDADEALLQSRRDERRAEIQRWHRDLVRASHAIVTSPSVLPTLQGQLSGHAGSAALREVDAAMATALQA